MYETFKRAGALAPAHSFTGGNPVNESILLEQVKHNIKRKDVMHFLGGNDNSKFVICGGSPSIKDYLPEIRKKAKSKKYKVCAVNGVHDYLLSKGIVPDFHLLADPQEASLSFVQKPRTGVTYFVASQCHPSVFDALQGHNVVMWHMSNCNEIVDWFAQHEGKFPFILVGGGSTGALRAINVGYIMGCREFELYGLDSSFGTDGQHAYKQKYKYTKEQILTVEVGTKGFITSGALLGQLRSLGEFLDVHGHLMNIKAFGNGMLPYWLKLYNEQRSEKCKLNGIQQ